MNKLLSILFFLMLTIGISAQSDTYNQMTADGNISQRGGGLSGRNNTDSTKNKTIPKGIRVWTVDERFGDTTPASLDTVSHMFMNSIFTTGLRGEYNTTGNMGAPRIHRIFIDRPLSDQFIFTQPYDFVITPVDKFHFTNTLSPITNLTFNTCGDRTNGEDHLTARFGVNAGKKLGIGFKFDYLYARGYYQEQSTAHFNYTAYGSYLGDRYQAHLLMSTNHQKITENGGITDDNYVTHPESYSDSYTTSEIPTVLERNWNRHDNQHVFLTHRFNVGFNRKVPMTEEEIKAKKFAIQSQKEKEERQAREKALKEGRDADAANDEQPLAGRPDGARIAGTEPVADSLRTDSTQVSDRILVQGKAAADSLLAAQKKAEQDTSWLKNEYVPVTSFIHTMKFDNYKRIYQAYQSPTDYYAHTYYNIGRLAGDSIYDKTRHYNLKNTFAISLLEGFNKWAKAGLKGFVSSDLRHFTLPDSLGGTNSFNEHNLSVGGQLIKAQGNTLHYNATFETFLIGEDAGQVKFDAQADLNFRLFGDTVTLAASGFFYQLNPTFYYRHYHSRHFWWDYDGNNDLSKVIHTRIQGLFSYKKTRTTLRVAVDEIKNHTYFAQSYNIDDDTFYRTATTLHVRQSDKAINLITASLTQDFTLGPLNWESVVTWQKSSNKDALPVPDLNIYTNLFLRFKIARVLKCDLGADARYFTKYQAPDYNPAIGQFVVQENEAPVEVGNYPVVNVYANFHLQHTRFFVMMSHVNAGSGKRNYFFTPHYPLNERILRFGLSWNFFN